jgi:apolipoprotein N-acyltransferase
MLARLPLFTSGSLSGDIQGYTGSTPFVRWGNMPVLIFWGGLGIALLAAAFRRRP